MSKMGQHYLDSKEYDFDFDSALYEYQQLCWEEANKPYQLTEEEEIAYNQYMKGELCGEAISTVHSATSSNSLNGLPKSIRLRRKRSSKR